MHIGIDVTSAAGPSSGVGNYTTYLVQNLSKFDKHNNYILFSYSWSYSPKLTFENSHKRIITHNLKIPTRFLITLWTNFNLPPIEVFIRNVDVFHSSDFVHPPQMRGKSVTTIHDLIAIRHPELVDPRVRKAQSRRIKTLPFKTDLFITVSESTKRDIISLMTVPENRIRVIPLAPCITNILPFAATPDKVSRMLGIRRPYILYLGAIEKRKNLTILLDAYSQLRRKNKVEHTLVLAGKAGWMFEEVYSKVKELDLANYVKFTGSISNDFLPGLMQGASLFVYPSSYEGFGLPPLEAMSCGVPVISSNTTSLPEVVDHAGILVNPLDVDAFTNAIHSVISSKSLQAEMREKGLKRAKEFSWENVAKQTLAVYKEL